MSQPRVNASALPRIAGGAPAKDLARRTYDRLFTVLDELDAADWQRPTGYRDWTVRDTVAHLYGMAGKYSSTVEYSRQVGMAQRLAQEEGLNEAEALVTAQIREQDALSDSQLLQRLRMAAPRALEGDQSRRRWFGALHVPQGLTALLHSRGPSINPLDALSNVTLLRDVWIHRIEIAQACERDPHLDSGADGAILADVVADWCEHVAGPAELDLTGPLAVHVIQGRGGPILRMDALDFVRLVSGREPLGEVPASPLLQMQVAF